MLVSSDVVPRIEGAQELLNGAEQVVVDAISADRADRWAPLTHGDRDVIFLQYTSGSTAMPKGVIVDRGNLLANERAIRTALRTDRTDVFVSWLPLFHDMGLVGGLLQPLYTGIPLVLMSPAYFLERPVRWLEQIARHRGSISGGPDFAYRLCLERVTDAQIASLDLSSWRVAFSGAEPVRHDTLRAFAERFAPAGFRAESVYPCYGLAEATLFVTGGRRGAGMCARTYSTEQLASGRATAARVCLYELGLALPPAGRDFGHSGEFIEFTGERNRRFAAQLAPFLEAFAFEYLGRHAANEAPATDHAAQVEALYAAEFHWWEGVFGRLTARNYLPDGLRFILVQRWCLAPARRRVLALARARRLRWLG